jgi:LysM repeat protein
MVMAARAFFEGVNAKMRSWGYSVEEQPGCWSRGNGSSWAHGGPVAHTNHHFVISLRSPIANGVQNVTFGDSSLSGPKCNYYGGLDPVTGVKRLVFISAGPANHAGRGRSEPRDRMAADEAPLGWVAESYSSAADNWSGGNTSYAGTELHHPGDATQWPAPLLELVVDLNAAMAIVGGWTAARCHMHAEHSARKIDMSWLRGQGGHELRRRVAARMTGTTPDPGDDSMSDAEVQALTGRINAVADKVDTLTNLLFAPGYATGGHSIREEQIFSQDVFLLPAIEKTTAGVNRLLYGGGRDDGSDRIADLAAQVLEIQNRVLQVGGRWDNFQDIVMRLDLILAALNIPVPGGPVLPPSPPETYTVQAGDTLTKISTVTGKSIADLVTWNNLASADAIAEGQVLRLGP